MNKKMILASASPRRREIIESAGFKPKIIMPNVDENIPMSDKISGPDVCMYLAVKKALAAEELYLGEKVHSTDKDAMGNNDEPVVIIAADTIVYDNRVIGKPVDEYDAFNILSSLRNKSHQVLTGVCLLIPATHSRRAFYEATTVFFKNYSDEFLHEYVKTPAPYDKAGGYAIQGEFARFIERYDGDYNNVVGFPLKRFLSELTLLF